MAASELAELTRRYLVFLDTVLGEGGPKGRPMDLIPPKSWTQLKEKEAVLEKLICKEIE